MGESIAVKENDGFAASLLRSQITTLLDVLKEIESNHPDPDYILNNLRRVEKNINWLRNIDF